MKTYFCLVFLLATAMGAQPAAVDVVEVATGFSSPIGVTHAGDGSNRLFVIQQTGQIRIWDGTNTLVTPFLDLSALTTGSGEPGPSRLGLSPQTTERMAFST